MDATEVGTMGDLIGEHVGDTGTDLQVPHVQPECIPHFRHRDQ